MRYIKVIGLGLALLALNACAGPAPTPYTPVSKAQIAAVEVALTAALNTANTCLKQTVGPCASKTIRPKLIDSEHKAVTAFMTLQSASAEGQPAALAALNIYIAELTAATPATK